MALIERDGKVFARTKGNIDGGVITTNTWRARYGTH